jgi:hypothetical protein
VFQYDVTICPTCSGHMKILAALTDPRSVPASTASAWHPEHRPSPRPTWLANSNSMRPPDSVRSGRLLESTPLCKTRCGRTETLQPHPCGPAAPGRFRPTTMPSDSSIDGHRQAKHTYIACHTCTRLTIMGPYPYYPPRITLICIWSCDGGNYRLPCWNPFSISIASSSYR